jgi:hypothetical protein
MVPEALLDVVEVSIGVGSTSTEFVGVTVDDSACRGKTVAVLADIGLPTLSG